MFEARLKLGKLHCIYLCSTDHPTIFPAGWPVLRTLHNLMPCVKVLNVEIVGFVFFVSYSSLKNIYFSGFNFLAILQKKN